MSERRFSVRSGEAGPLGPVVDRIGPEAAKALGDGRLFVGKRRALSREHLVAEGDEIVVYSGRGEPTEGARILDVRDGVVAAYKPAAMSTIPDHRGARGSLVAEVARLLGGKVDAWHPTSRLDVGVSGVVLLARTEAARERLARARAQATYVRHYVAIASRTPAEPSGLWSWPIGRAGDPRLRAAFGEGAKPAATAFAAVATTDGGAVMLAVEPRTGRTHQIRVHAAHAGAPLYGDPAYGGPLRVVSRTGAVTRLGRIALHAAWVEVPGDGGEPYRVEAPVPDDLSAIWRALSGDDAAWARALAARPGASG